MYCPNCGAENNNADKFCAECGAQLWNKVTSDKKDENVVYNKPGTLNYTTENSSEMSSSVNTISKFIVLAGILCYFLTFVKIGGLGLRGSDFIFMGNEKVQTLGAESNMIFFDPFVFGAAVCGIIAFWFKKRRMWLSFAAGILLILFRIFKIGLAPFSEVYDVIDIIFGAPLYVSIAAFICAGMYLKFFND